MAPVKPVSAVLFKLLNMTTFKAMKGQAAPGGGGGGQQDVRFGTGEEPTYIFGPGPNWRQAITAIGTGIKRELHAVMQPARNNEWRVMRQLSDRHPAWSALAGFPEDADPDNLPRAVLWLAKTADGEVYAGLLDTEREGRIPHVLRALTTELSEDRTTRGQRFEGAWAMMDLTRAALRALKTKPCVLLYGPPGTGKTRAMQELRAFLEAPASAAALGLDPTSPDTPFVDLRVGAPEFPGEIRCWWMTFHQGTTYEDFMLGLRPFPEGPGVKLEHRAGPLLEALEHARAGNTSVLLVDEINRGNVARILGDFITFMEFDKRSKPGLPPDPIEAVPLTFPSLDQDPTRRGQSVSIRFAAGAKAVPHPYYVPYHIYLVGSMNSLDRSVAPLDTALARRFRRIEAPVDYDALRKHLAGKATAEPAALAAELLLAVNTRLRVDFGEDFQLGPAYLWNAFDPGGLAHLQELGRAWDEELLPQLRELYRNRPEELGRLLYPDRRTGDWPYRFEPDEEGTRRLVEARPLARLGENNLRAVLAALAGRAPAVEGGGADPASAAPSATA